MILQQRNYQCNECSYTLTLYYQKGMNPDQSVCGLCGGVLSKQHLKSDANCDTIVIDKLKEDYE